MGQKVAQIWTALTDSQTGGCWLMAQCRVDKTNSENQAGHLLEPRAGAVLTAVDLGSNSFYLMQGRMTGDRLTVTRRLRQSVRLVAGVDAGGALDPARQKQAFDCLERFGEITRSLAGESVHAVATSAVRRLTRPQEFLQRASMLLGQPIEVIDGLQEGRLIWLGASGALPAVPVRRLIVDIGGGSTECIVGRSRQAEHVASIDIGCIVSCRAFFADGRITAQRWQQAQQSLQAEIEPHRAPLQAHGWEQAWGTSGSARAIGAIVRALGTATEGITAAAVADLRRRLLEAGHVDHLDLPELSRNGSQVIAGTVAVLEALFEVLDLDHIALCDAAMREGILRALATRARDAAQSAGAAG